MYDIICWCHKAEFTPLLSPSIRSPSSDKSHSHCPVNNLASITRLLCVSCSLNNGLIHFSWYDTSLSSNWNIEFLTSPPTNRGCLDFKIGIGQRKPVKSQWNYSRYQSKDPQGLENIDRLFQSRSEVVSFVSERCCWFVHHVRIPPRPGGTLSALLVI